MRVLCRFGILHVAKAMCKEAPKQALCSVALTRLGPQGMRRPPPAPDWIVVGSSLRPWPSHGPGASGLGVT